MDDKERLDFPSNSHRVRSQKEEKKIEKVIQGKVVTRKKTLGRKFGDLFLGDSSGGVMSYVVNDILIPAMKSTVSDMVCGGVEMLLGTTRGSRSRRDKGKSYVSYSSYYKSDRDERREPSMRNRTRHDFDDIILDSRGEAEEVLSHLVDLTEDYGMATVSDLYDLVGMTGSFTDNKYGWTNLSNATITRVRDGYLIDLPKTSLLD